MTDRMEGGSHWPVLRSIWRLEGSQGPPNSRPSSQQLVPTSTLLCPIGFHDALWTLGALLYSGFLLLETPLQLLPAHAVLPFSQLPQTPSLDSFLSPPPWAASTAACKSSPTHAYSSWASRHRVQTCLAKFWETPLLPDLLSSPLVPVTPILALLSNSVLCVPPH